MANGHGTRRINTLRHRRIATFISDISGCTAKRCGFGFVPGKNIAPVTISAVGQVHYLVTDAFQIGRQRRTVIIA
ncbi:hypothetical protein D3C75_1197160 [compost metagenome]